MTAAPHEDELSGLLTIAIARTDTRGGRQRGRWSTHHNPTSSGEVSSVDANHSTQSHAAARTLRPPSPREGDSERLVSKRERHNSAIETTEGAGFMRGNGKKRPATHPMGPSITRASNPTRVRAKARTRDSTGGVLELDTPTTTRKSAAYACLPHHTKIPCKAARAHTTPSR